MAIPSVITNLTAPTTASIKSSINISWQASSGATTYTVFASYDNSDYIQIGTVSTTTYSYIIPLGYNEISIGVKAKNSDGSSEMVKSNNIDVVYLEIDSNGKLQPFNELVDFTQYPFDILPNTKDTTEELAGIDGEIVIETKYEPRLFEIVSNSEMFSTIALKETSLSDKAKVLNYFKKSERYLKYKGKLYKVKLASKPEITNYPFFYKSVLTLKAYNPYGYSERKYCTSSTFTVSGDEETHPIIYLTGLKVLPTITINGTDYLYSGTIQDGKTVVINCDKKTVTIDGVSVIGYWGDKFPYFKLGTNTVTTPTSTIKYEYREKYISL